jgi:putative membrane protein
MKYRILLLLILAVSGIVFQSCQSSERSNEAGDSTVVDHTVVDTTEITGRSALENEVQTAMFIETVAQGGMLEVTLGKLAMEIASNPGVKSFAKLMVQDHNEMNDRLKALSAEKGLKLPVSLPPKELQQVRQMSQMKTAYFEKLYMKMMIEDHNKDIELFRGAGNSPDTAISNFSRKFLPVLETHKERALKVREGIKD